jgi:hypothetical protein
MLPSTIFSAGREQSWVPLRARHKIYADRSDRLIDANGSVIGIDVGWSPARRSSAICRLDWSDSVVVWEIARFDRTGWWWTQSWRNRSSGGAFLSNREFIANEGKNRCC